MNLLLQNNVLFVHDNLFVKLWITLYFITWGKKEVDISSLSFGKLTLLLVLNAWSSVEDWKLITVTLLMASTKQISSCLSQWIKLAFKSWHVKAGGIVNLFVVDVQKCFYMYSFHVHRSPFCYDWPKQKHVSVVLGSSQIKPSCPSCWTPLDSWSFATQHCSWYS